MNGLNTRSAGQEGVKEGGEGEGAVRWGGSGGISHRETERERGGGGREGARKRETDRQTETERGSEQERERERLYTEVH